MYKKFKLKAYCIIEKDSKILLVKDVGKDGWKLPGGFVEEKELIRSAAVREVKEETGYLVRLTGFVGVHEYIKDDGTHVIRFHFASEIVGGNEKLREGEIAEVKWMEKEDVTLLEEKDFFIKPYYVAVKDFLKTSVYSIELVKVIEK